MRLFWWLYALIFVVARILKTNYTYLFVAGMFAIAAAISELGWKVRNAFDRLYESLYEEEES